MALSDYLTSDEWDACFYAFFGQHMTNDFGASMRMSINRLLSLGYQFPGLDSTGSKLRQVENGVNAEKLLFFFGMIPQEQTNQMLTSGRNFWLKHDPKMVDETDDEWAEQTEKALTIKH